jgi:hypothetical protein
MYVINYENNGFIIVSADKRISPILAYSDEGRFATDQKVIPGGVVSWMASVNETISSIRNSNMKQDETVKRLWKRYSEEQILNPSTSTNSAGRTNTTVYIGDCNNGDSGFTEFTDGLVATPTWNQGSGYNELLTNAGCSQTGNGRYWTGCVATATAEIMRFYSPLPLTIGQLCPQIQAVPRHLGLCVTSEQQVTYQSTMVVMVLLQNLRMYHVHY